MKKVFTTGQVAKICKVAPRTVSKWFDSGRLRGYRIPGSQDRRIPREHLIKFLKEHGMPLGELEEEGLHKILIIGAEKLFIDRVKEVHPLFRGDCVLVLSDGTQLRLSRSRRKAFEAMFAAPPSSRV